MKRIEERPFLRLFLLIVVGIMILAGETFINFLMNFIK